MRTLPNATFVIVAILLLCVSTSGCSGLRSWMPGSSRVPQESPSGFADTLSNTSRGITGQFKSMGSAMSSAYSKTKDAVTKPFSGTPLPNSDNPTSLSNMPPKSSLGPEIWVTNGQLYESQSNFDKALDNYTKALELEPDNVAALLSTARLYSRRNQHEQATEFFAKAISVSPQSDSYNEMALCLQNQARTSEAIAAVQKAIELDPSNPRYRNNLAGMLVSSGRSDEAVQSLQQVFPPAVANYNVAYLHFQNNNVAASQQHLQQALQIDPNLGLARDLMAQISTSAAAKSAMAAYQTAGTLYRTAEGLASPTVNANPAVYQQGNSVSTGASQAHPMGAPSAGNSETAVLAIPQVQGGTLPAMPTLPAIR